MPSLPEIERALRQRLDALGPAPRAELLHVLMLPDFDRADRIGEFSGNAKTRAFAELLIDCEEDRTIRAVLVGMLREADEKPTSSRRLPKVMDMVWWVLAGVVLASSGWSSS